MAKGKPKAKKAGGGGGGKEKKKKLTKEERKRLKKEEQERLAREAEEARVQAEEEERQRLEREQQQAEERRLLEAEQRVFRRMQLIATDNAVQQLQLQLADALLVEAEQEKWERYMRCDGLPDPLTRQEVTAYLSMWRETPTAEETHQQVMERTGHVLRVIDDLRLCVQQRAYGEDEQADDMAAILQQYQDTQREKLDVASYNVVADMRPHIDLETNQLQFCAAADHLALALWSNCSKNLKNKGFHFQEMGVRFELPKELMDKDIAVRILRTQYDHHSQRCRTRRMLDLAEFRSRESLSDVILAEDKQQEEAAAEAHRQAALRAEQEAAEAAAAAAAAAAEAKAAKKRMPWMTAAAGSGSSSPEKAGSRGSSTARSDRSDASSKGSKHGRKKKRKKKKGKKGGGGGGGSSKSPKRKGTPQPEPEPEPAVEPMPTLMQLAESPGEVNLRRHRVIGGLIQFDLLHLPPQPRLLGTWTLHEVCEPQTVRSYPFTAEYRAPAPADAAGGRRREPEEIEREIRQQEAEMQKLIATSVDPVQAGGSQAEVASPDDINTGEDSGASAATSAGVTASGSVAASSTASGAVSATASGADTATATATGSGSVAVPVTGSGSVAAAASATTSGSVAASVTASGIVAAVASGIVAVGASGTTSGSVAVAAAAPPAPAEGGADAGEAAAAAGAAGEPSADQPPPPPPPPADEQGGEAAPALSKSAMKQPGSVSRGSRVRISAFDLPPLEEDAHATTAAAGQQSEQLPPLLEGVDYQLEVAERPDNFPLLETRLPASTLWFEPPMFVRWDDEHACWSTDGFYDTRYNEDTLVLQTRTLRLGLFGLAVNRFSNLPYQSWSYAPTGADSGQLHIAAAVAGVKFNIQGNRVSVSEVSGGTSDCLQAFYDQPMKPEQLIQLLQSRGLDVFPEEDSYIYIEGSSLKHQPCEKHLYWCMALVGSAYAFDSSRWNLLAGAENIVLQFKEMLSDELQGSPALLLVQPRKATILECVEGSQAYSDTEAPGMPYFSDLYHLVLALGSEEARRRYEAASCTFVNCLHSMFQATRLLSYS